MTGGRPRAVRSGVAVILWTALLAMSLRLSLLPGVVLFGGACVVAWRACVMFPNRRALWINLAGLSAVLLLAELCCLIFLGGGHRGDPKTQAARVQERPGARPVRDVSMLDVPRPNGVWKPDESWIRLPELDDGAVYWYPDVLEATENGFLQLKPNAKARSVRLQKGVVRYDATYTSNQYGLRDTPAADPTKPTVAFFGCSFAFGRGLNDHETLPNQFVLQSGRRFSALNFAMAGHAPNNALMMFEEEKERTSTAGTTVAAGVYVTMWDHPRRIVGGRFWTKGYPRYVLRAGVPVREGVITRAFEYRPGIWGTREEVLYILRKFALLDVLIDATIKQDSFLANLLLEARARRNIDLYAAVLKRASDIFEARYHAPFVVVGWLRDKPEDRAIYQALMRAGLRVIDLSDLISGKEDALTIPNDGHPNAVANRLVAERLLTYFQAMKVGSGPQPIPESD